MAERPLLMDKQWENIQKKTFTKWVNSHMAKRGQSVTEFVTDFQDGLKLISFFEIISNKDIGARFEKKPKMRIQYIQNVSTALKFLADQKVKLVSISAEDIVDGNLKLILGMIWTIILRFQIEDISVEELSSRDALLLWCKKKTEGYRDCKVENFHTSWQDGMAFCAIIHKHRPDLIDYDSLSKNSPRENLKLAFDIAEKEFGIPQLLDLEDIVDIAKPDERSIITYVSQYYHYFSAGRKQEVAGRRIGKLVDMANQIESLKADYNLRAEELAKWIKDKTEAHKDHNFGDNGVAGIKDLIQQFNDYKEGEKSDKAAEKLALEALFNSIALKLRANNRGTFVPPAGSSVQDIQNYWEGLLAAERDRDDALRKELERQEKLDLLNRRFNQKADKLEAWIAAKEKYLAKDENVDSLNSAKERIKHHDQFYDEYADSKPRLAELEEIAKEIAALNAPNTQQVNDRVKNIKGRWEGLQGSADNKKENLRKKLEIQQRIEELRIDFAKLAKEYNRWVGSTIDKVNDYTFGESLEDVQQYKAELDKETGSQKAESTEKLQKLQAVWAQMQELGITDLKYTVLTIKDLENRNTQLEEALKKREAAYEAELQRQFLLEQKRKEFAAMASAFIEHLAERKKQISSLEGEPEPLVEAVKQEYNDGNVENTKLDQIKAFNTELSELGINENKHTEYTPSILAKQSAQLGNFVRNYIQDLNEERDLKADYARRAQKILDWINSTLPQLNDRNFDNTLQGARERSAEFQQYKTGPKAEAAANKPEIERLYETISNLLKKSNRPPFTPAAGLALNDIDAQWNVLEESEHSKEEALAKELFRQENLATLVRRFNSDASDLDSWADEKGKYLSENPEISSLFKAQFEVKLFEAYGTEFKNRQPRFKQLEELKNQIGAENYSDSASIEARFNEISGKLSGLENVAGNKSQFLQEQLAIQQKNENLRYEFARLAKDYNSWVKSSIDKIEDYNFGFTLDQVNSYKKDLTASDNEYRTKADEKEAKLQNVVKELEAAGVTDAAKHSQFSADDLKSLRSNLEAALNARDAAHQEETKKQTAAEEYRKVFAGKATEFVAYLAGAKSDLESTAGSSDEKIATIKSKHNAGAVGKEKVGEITTLGNQMKAEGVYGNNHTKYTVPGLVSKNNQHNLQVENLLSGLTEEKEMQERIALQEAELKESEKKENLVLDFNAKATALNQWIENADESLNDPINTNSVEDAEKLSKEFAQLESQLAQKQTNHDNLIALAQEMRSLNVNDFSGITPEELTEVFNKVKSSAQERKAALAKELENQKQNDALSQEFAKKATSFSQWIKDQTQALSSQKGDLEQQLDAVQKSRANYEAKATDLADLEKSSRALEKAGVKRNKYTDLSHRTLASEYEGLGAATAKQETLLTNEIMAKKGSDISPEQINEIKEVFKHFDKNHDNSLGRLELKACLQALGDEPSDSELDAIMKEVDPTNQGVTFQAFANFYGKRTKDTDSKEEILVSFKEIANDKDFVTEVDLRKVMSNDKVAYLVANMPKYGEHGFDYKKWVEQQY